jgi:hypothetical protein
MRHAVFCSMMVLLAIVGSTLAQPSSVRPTPPTSLPLPAAVNSSPSVSHLEGGASTDRPTPAASLGIDDGPNLEVPTPAPLPELHGQGPNAERYYPTQEASAFPYTSWVSAEYLFWEIKNGPRPPSLVTISSAQAPNPGVLGTPGTAVLFPTSNFDYGDASGGHWKIGSWLNYHETLGVEITGLLLEQRSVGFSALANSAGFPVLGVPFQDAVSRLELVDFVSFPGRFAGGIDVTSRSRLWGMEGTLLSNGIKTQVGGRADPVGDFRADFLGGFRYLDLDENLEVVQTSIVLRGGSADFNGKPVGPGHVLLIRDGFSCRNQFYGGQIGVQGEFTHGCFFVDFLGKLGLGATREMIEVSGNTVLTGGLEQVQGRPRLLAVIPPATAEGGLLATATNIGKRQKERFSVLPELGITLGYQLHPLFRVFAGYTFLYLSDVVRPGDQVDRVINLSRVPTSGSFAPMLQGPARPALPFRETDFWAHGFNFGFEFCF